MMTTPIQKAVLGNRARRNELAEKLIVQIYGDSAMFERMVLAAAKVRVKTTDAIAAACFQQANVFVEAMNAEVRDDDEPV